MKNTFKLAYGYQRCPRCRPSSLSVGPQAQNVALKTMNEAQISPPKAAKILKFFLSFHEKCVFVSKSKLFLILKKTCQKFLSSGINKIFYNFLSDFGHKKFFFVKFFRKNAFEWGTNKAKPRNLFLKNRIKRG